MASASSAGWANRLRLCTHNTAWSRCTATSPGDSFPAGTVRVSTAEWPQFTALSAAATTEGPVWAPAGDSTSATSPERT